MATPAERKALLFFALVATLGAGVRLWRARHADNHVTTSAEETDRSFSDDDSPRASSPGSTRGSTYGARKSTKGGSASPRSRSQHAPTGRGSRTGQTFRDLGTTIDLDRANLSEIDALGVLQPGVARLIVADRDSFGPFGSIQELERVPYLSTAVIRKLAPRVTFSRLPRPKNTVIQPRSHDASVTVSRRARKRKVPVQ